MVCGDLSADLIQFAPQHFPDQAPLVPYWAAHNSHGEGECRRNSRDFVYCSSASPGDRFARTVGFFLQNQARVTQRCCALRSEPFPHRGVLVFGTGLPRPLTPSARPIEPRSPGALIFMATAVVRELFPIGTGLNKAFGRSRLQPPREMSCDTVRYGFASGFRRHL